MPQPPAYSPAFSFTEDEAANPAARPPGVNMDAEYAAIATTLAQVLANLVKIQRDDGALKNAVVTMDALTPAVILALASDVNPRGDWAAATNYALLDLIENGSATYICATAHTSSGDFATDYAVPSRWVRLYDSGGSVPADASVTPDKLAPGSVTTPAIGFTSLDLTGTIRGQAGLLAGTATAGVLIHGKAAVGDAICRIERTTEAQGAVGFAITGVADTWQLAQPASSAVLQLTRDSQLQVAFSNLLADFSGAVRAQGAAPTSGAGVHLNYVSSIGYLSAFDYGAGQWKDLRLQGKDVYVSAGGVEVLKATSTGVQLTGTVTVNGSQIGYIGVPQNAQNGTYTLAIGDNGKAIYSENVGGQTITVPPNVFDNDDVIIIINDGNSPITLQQGAGVTLRLTGSASTGNRTIAAGAWATIKCVKSNRFFVGGPGVS